MKYLIIIFAVAIIALAGLLYLEPQTKSEIKTFSSYSELANFLKQRTEQYATGGFRELAVTESVRAPTSAKASEYSTTNIQVEGVDEPDIVKTDGKYIYTISQNRLIIVDAYPAENAKILSQIEPEGSVSNMFINQDKLVLFGNSYPDSFINVYDISDRSAPVLEREVTLRGYYQDARMIGDYAYAIVTQPIQILDEKPVLPLMKVDSAERLVQPNEIAYFDNYDSQFVYNFVVALNTQTDEEPNQKVYLLGYSQSMYVSSENIYIVLTKTMSYTEKFNRLLDRAVLPAIPFHVSAEISSIRNQDINEYEKMQKIQEIISNYTESLSPEQGAEFMSKIEKSAQEVSAEIEKQSEKTIIHKIGISNSQIEYKASGEVPGHVLNQFSMDEYDGNFRIATTTGNTWDNSSLNHIYVLNSDLQIIGKLEDLAKGEQIYSARFLGERTYLVTFVRTDPLFVIDLSNPASPKVLGELKIPGFSEYLHPYDENHLIGLGQQTDENGRRTGELKVSLFDVTDVSNPTESSTYLIGDKDSYSHSEALNDHKAFLFSKSKNLLVIPVSTNNWQANEYFQGAYVFNINENNLDLQGKITHTEGNASEDRYYYDYASNIRRSLFMDSILYTISEKTIKANSISDLSDISEVDLGVKEEHPILIK